MRKHRQQMKPSEIEALELRIRAICQIDLAAHAAQRMQDRGVSEREIQNAIKYGYAIEIHDDTGELRAVVRHDYGRPKVAVCVVISLEDGTIVSTWKNKGCDNHKSLNLFAYQWHERVEKILERVAI